MDEVTFAAGGRRVYQFSAWQLAGAAVLALALGFAGALSGRMYTRHNDQHWAAEQFQQRQEAFNQQVVAAIQQLQRAPAPPLP